MSLFSGFLAQAQPRPQSAYDTITKLCDRLIHSNLLEDRRGAILGLKGFSREYRETVVASGFKGILTTLKRDILDQDTTRACLEALLILFLKGEENESRNSLWLAQQTRSQNGKYPSPILLEGTPIDHISLWLADELTQNEENITLLLQILENNDFFIRLYCLQLLGAVTSIRPARTKECILMQPLGISSLVAVLDDNRDAIRNEAILLVMNVVNDHYNIQKLVAFENTFDKVFSIIDDEGGIEGGIVVQDCLCLMSSLLKYNVSNQKLFLETNCAPKLARLLETNQNPPIRWDEQREQNVSLTLDICREFVTEGNDATETSQFSLTNSGVLMNVLRLVFAPGDVPISIRTSGLLVTGDLIRGNSELQFQFSGIDVPFIDLSLPIQLQNVRILPVTIALLHWTLSSNSVHLFDLRVGSSMCLAAYFDNNDEAKRAFLMDQISAFHKLEGTAAEPIREITPETSSSKHSEDSDSPVKVSPALSSTGVSSTDVDYEESRRLAEINDESQDTVKVSTPVQEPASAPAQVAPQQSRPSSPSSSIEIDFNEEVNIFASLLLYDSNVSLNPYKVWFSAVLLMYIFQGSNEMKDISRKIIVGNETEGEEAISSIQAMSGLLLTTLNNSDPRISIAYLMVLIDWLYEDLAAVNDFLSESSTINTLVGYITQTINQNQIVQGMSALLLGIVYDFSSKDSTIKRSDLHSLLLKTLGKDQYVLKLQQFKNSEVFKYFDEQNIFIADKDETGLPEVFFDPIFVHLIKENFKRISKSLDRDPNADTFARISLEMYEDLQQQFNELSETYESLIHESNSFKESFYQQFNEQSSQLETTKAQFETTKQELIKLQASYKQVSTNIESTSRELGNITEAKVKLEASTNRYFQELQESRRIIDEYKSKEKQLINQLSSLTQLKEKAEAGVNKLGRELYLLTKETDEKTKKISNLERDLKNASNDYEKTISSIKNLLNRSKNDLKLSNDKLKEINGKFESSEQLNLKLNKELKEIEDQRDHSEQLVATFYEKLQKSAKQSEDLKSKLKILEIEKEELIESNKKSNILIESLKQQLESTSVEFEKIESELRLQITNIESKNQSLEEHITKLTSENSSEKEKVDKLTQINQNTKNDLKSTKLKLEEVNNKVETLETLEKELKSQIIKLENSNKAKEEKVKNKVGLLKEKIERISELENLEVEYQNYKESSKNSQKKLNQTILEQKNSILQTTSEKEELAKNHEKELKSIKSELVNLKKEKNKLETDLTQITEEKEKLLKSLEETKDKLSSASTKLSENVGILVKTKKELKGVNEKLSNAEEDVISLKSQIEKQRHSLEEERAMLTVDASSAIQEYSKKINEANEENARSEMELKRSLSLINSLEKSSDEKAKELDKLKESIETLKQEHATELENIKKEKTTLDTDLKDKLKYIDQLKSDIETSKTELGNAQTVTEKLNTVLTESKKKVNKLELEFKEQSKEYEVLKKAKEDVHEKLAVLEKEKNTLNDNLSEATKRETSLKESLDKTKVCHEEELSEIKQEKTSLEFTKNVEISVLKSDKKSLQDSLEKIKEGYEQQLDQLKKELEQSRIEAKNNSDMVPRSELEDLMLLMQDLDESKDKYKDRVKELDPDFVSDDESDDEDDD